MLGREHEGIEDSPVATKKRLVEIEDKSTSGEAGTVVNITGRWKLDTVKSDRMDTYLSTMVRVFCLCCVYSWLMPYALQGLSQTAIEAAAKAEQEHATINIIKQTDTSFQITRRSRMINATKEYKLGEEVTETVGKSGSKKVLITAGASAVTTVTTLSMGRQLIDTRTLEEGGKIMAFEIELITPETRVSIKRYFTLEEDVVEEEEKD
jgi:hypothetical protein